MDRPFSDAWRDVLEERWAWHHRLPEEVRCEIERLIQVIVAEKSWEACGGLEEITDEMVVLISAQAALLLVGRNDHDFYPQLRSILLYPSGYVDSGRRSRDLKQDEDARLGESWSSGSVVLAWDEVIRGAAGAHDGTNLVLHEFAHQLDQIDGAADGAPVLDDWEDYQDWSRVFSEHYQELVEDVEADRNTLIDDYGATNPAEFFAVATETFFERPKRLLREAPDLYAQLREFYGLDPSKW